VTNWRDYDAALRDRGSSTIRFTEEALAGWRALRRKTPGGRVVYSTLAIETALTLRAIFRLALRRSEALIATILRMPAIDPPVADHTTPSRPACRLPVHDRARIGTTGAFHLIVDSMGLKLRGAGEWLFDKHGTAKRRAWRKLHIGIDADSGQIVAFDPTARTLTTPRMLSRSSSNRAMPRHRSQRMAPMMARQLTRRSRSMARPSGP
jgi:hypothetical protein